MISQHSDKMDHIEMMCQIIHHLDTLGTGNKQVSTECQLMTQRDRDVLLVAQVHGLQIPLPFSARHIQYCLQQLPTQTSLGISIAMRG